MKKYLLLFLIILPCFVLGGFFVARDAFAASFDPLANSGRLSVGDYLFSGECNNDNTSRLLLIDNYNSTTTVASIGDFNINCIDGRWSAVSEVSPGLNAKYVLEYIDYPGHSTQTMNLILYLGGDADNIDQAFLQSDSFLGAGAVKYNWLVQSFTAERDTFTGLRLFGVKGYYNWNFPFLVLCKGVPVFTGSDDATSSLTFFCGDQAEWVGGMNFYSTTMTYGKYMWWNINLNNAIRCWSPSNNTRSLCPNHWPLEVGESYFIKAFFYGSWQYDYKASIRRNANGGYEGGQGYLLNEDHNKLTEIGDWSFATLYDPSQESKVDPVILVPGILGSWNLGFGWQLDPILHTYDNLWEALKLAGYEEGGTLFAFPYNWRLPNIYTAGLLKEKIAEVKEICQCNKVDIVAHSMGGLVARAYIQMLNYEDDIDQLIFLGTPHQGSAKSYLAWEGGDLGPNREDFLFERIFQVEAEFNGFGSTYLYMRNLPMKSVQELLPIYDYLRDKDTMELRAYPNNYPRNTFLELLNQPTVLSKLNGVNMVNVVGKMGENSTINNFRVVENTGSDGEWEHGYPDRYRMPFTDHGMEYSRGDQTVPYRSNNNFYGLNDVMVVANHNKLVTDAQSIVIEELTGKTPEQEIKNFFDRIMLVRIFSPADFKIIAPDGKILGKDFVTGNIINEIEGGFYSGYQNGPEFAVILDPMDGEYQIELQGTGRGEYKLSVSYMDEVKNMDKEYQGNIVVDQIQTFKLNYDEHSDEPIGEVLPLFTSIEELIGTIDNMYGSKIITNKSAMIKLRASLKVLSLRLNQIDRQLALYQKLIEGIENNDKLNTVLKQRIIEKYNTSIDRVADRRQQTISLKLNYVQKRLENMRNKDRITQLGYDIIQLSIQYLKNNL